MMENLVRTNSTCKIFYNDLCAETLVHFGGSGRIQNFEACHRNHPETSRQVPGHFMKQFSDYTDVQGYKIPFQITTSGGKYS